MSSNAADWRSTLTPSNLIVKLARLAIHVKLINKLFKPFPIALFLRIALSTVFSPVIDDPEPQTIVESHALSFSQSRISDRQFGSPDSDSRQSNAISRILSKT